MQKINKQPKSIKQVKSIKQTLRQTMAKKRQALSTVLKRKKAKALLQVIADSPLFQKAQKIAFYWPIKGEIDPRPLLHLALKMGKRCYLPVLHPKKTKSLLFIEYQSKDRLQRNRYGIPEPRLLNKGFKGLDKNTVHRSQLASSRLTPARLAPSKFHIVFVPLLAFNKKGQRLGSGGGYYDKTFAFLKKRKKPQLIGLAYGFQEQNKIPQETWDLLLSGVATEKSFFAIDKHH